MKLSYEKITHLSHVVVDAIQGLPGLELGQVANDVRNRILLVVREELRHDEEIENRVRKKIASQKRNIPEGSPEWDILFRKYYEEEIAGLRGA